VKELATWVLLTNRNCVVGLKKKGSPAMSLTVREDGNIAGLEQMFTQSASETGETSAEASWHGADASAYTGRAKSTSVAIGCYR
jgi:hypothetical protein